MTDRAIAQSAQFITAQLAYNKQLAGFSALSATSEKTVRLYGIYAVLAQAHGIGRPTYEGKHVSNSQEVKQEDDELETGKLKLSRPPAVLKTVERALINFVDLKVAGQDTMSVVPTRETSPAVAVGPESRDADDMPAVAGPAQAQEKADADLEWAILGLAALSVYSSTLAELKAQTLPLSQDLLYWDSVVTGDYETLYLGLYAVQMVPLQVVSWVKGALAALLQNSRGASLAAAAQSLSPRRIKQAVSETLLSGQRVWSRAKRLRRRLAKTVANPLAVVLLIYSPFNQARAAVKLKRSKIRAFRNTSAQTIGFLVGKGLTAVKDRENWTREVSVQVRNMEVALVQDLTEARTIVAEQGLTVAGAATSLDVANQLLEIIQTALPTRAKSYSAFTAQYGTPSKAQRYWPAALGLGVAARWAAVSAFQNRAAIMTWLRTQVFDTVLAFYENWIVAPLTKIYKTVRHDSNEQVALMTRQSLEADMRSLERMVVAFAEATSSSSSVAPGDLEAIRLSVQQGDISSVLIPYELQIQTPLKSAVTGQLVQALLIQIQKTKVDVEVAVSGIDKLLKSQELVFGVVAALPSLAVTAWVLRGVAGLLTNPGRSKRLRGRREQGETVVRVLGRVDRLLLQLTAYTPDDDAKYYQALGLLLCETSLLRDLGRRVLPAGFRAQWEVDLSDLEDFRVSEGGSSSGVDVVHRQRLVLARIYNVYGSRF